jgi:hypothetical protein
MTTTTAEDARLAEATTGGWRRWGPYLSERQWGTVREDVSENGDAWSSFPHDHARSRAYRWGEDGMAGLSDERQQLCFALALWNGNDPILKERLFGLTNSEGNHGEDVKEYYSFVDATPTHSYLRWQYAYPLDGYPYGDLVQANRRRSRTELEYELIDTGVFDEDRYAEVVVEYAKARPDDIAVRITVRNRSAAPATVHVMPHLWFRNTWAWDLPGDTPSPRPSLRMDGSRVRADHHRLGSMSLACDGEVTWLFTENDTNVERLQGRPNPQPYVKDAFHRYVVNRHTDAVNPAMEGTKCAALVVCQLPAAGEQVIRLRLRPTGADAEPFGPAFDGLLAQRIAEADEFYAARTPAASSPDEATVMRQALAGMIWSKQYYLFDLDRWLRERGAHPMHPGARRGVRNQGWFHMHNDDVISMPDTWEYPWYAAWDLAFHTLPLTMVDPEFAKQQLELMLSEVYLHPNGQIPAYEWNFGDVNPPVHAWATWHAYLEEKQRTGTGDLRFLEEAFQKLLLNFTWWVNRKDPTGRNVFEGGFLGLDNIGVFDRSAPLPTGGSLEQADGTAWMAFFSQHMLQIALELTQADPVYEDMALKFLEHFFLIAASMDRVGSSDDELWDDEDGFFYDVLRMPDGTGQRLRVRSLVGLLPLCAVTVISAETLAAFPSLMERAGRTLRRYGGLLARIHDPAAVGVGGRHLLSVLPDDKLRRVLARMLDEERFLSPYGIRSLSKWHEDHPFVFDVHGQRYEVRYLPAESDSGMFGGNSNWRGPVWMPANMLIVRALLQMYLYYGDEFTVECPTGSGVQMNLFQVAEEISRRLVSIFTLDDDGRRPVFGGVERFQTDPAWRDLIPFYEYFHGDDGAGLGASHQTGWTGLVATLIQGLGRLDPSVVLDGGVILSAGQAERAPSS